MTIITLREAKGSHAAPLLFQLLCSPVDGRTQNHENVVFTDVQLTQSTPHNLNEPTICSHFGVGL